MKKKEKARVHEDLDGLELSINSFGEIKSNVAVEKVNDFLNKNVEDKKLKKQKTVNKDQETDA